MARAADGTVLSIRRNGEFEFRGRQTAVAAILAFGVGPFGVTAHAAGEGGFTLEKVSGANEPGAVSPSKVPETSAPAMQIASRASSAPIAALFNPKLFAGHGIDLSRFERGNPVEPGVYSLDVRVNGEGRGRMDVTFRAVSGSNIASPCFTLAMLDRLGVDGQALAKRLVVPGENGEAEENDTNDKTPDPAACHSLREALPDATYTFDSSDLTLDLTVPQIDLRKTARGYVDPSRWDNGINAGLLQYNVNAYTTDNKSSSGNTSTFYAGLQAGVNLGPWRFRQRSTLNWTNRASGTNWRAIETYAQRDITAWRSRVTLGDSYTSGEIFDSFGLRGAQLASDDSMLPTSLQSYAPTIRGVADTNAHVVVRQRGNIIYEASVPPGPFAFDDLPPVGYGGDLVVTVTESDGRTKQFTVPYASLPQLLRPGQQRFNVTAGQYRDALSGGKPWVGQLTYQRGLSNLLTGYAGLLSSAGYGSGLIGIALNTPVGALAFDLTAARTSLPAQGARSGLSSRVSYSNMVDATGTNFSVAAYRYSTSNFYSLSDAIRARGGLSSSDRQSLIDYRARERLQLQVNQRIGERSSMSVSGSVQNYWADRGRDLQFQVNFSSAFKRVSYTLYAQRNRVSGTGNVTQVGVNLSIPLGGGNFAQNRAFNYLTTSLSRSSAGDSAIQANLTGSGPDTVPVDYGITASRIAGGDSRLASLGVNGTYRSPFGTYNANASVSNQARQAAFGANGAVILHRGGVTLSPPLGQAAALVEADGAKGARLINGQGASIDRFGYGVISSLTPYRVNTVAIDPSKLPDDVELGNTSEEVVPRRNSIVLVKMETKRGRLVFATVETAEGKPLPMGSELFDAAGKAIGGVGQGGMAYLRGLEGTGSLVAKWGAGPSEQCAMPYSVPDATRGAAAGGARKPGSQVVRVRLRCEAALAAN